MSAFTAKNVFVNPFYQEGVGRRTGIVVKKDVRKDSDGFEVFDDYWSESENDATMHTTCAAEKENNDGTIKKRSLKSMPSFTPQEASSDREASKVELPQDVSQAADNASALEADITGSIIKGPAPSLEPSSALSKFKTRQRLSFSEATTSEESLTSEGEGSVGDEGESQESGTSSEGTVKAPSSQSELSQDEGDGSTETEEDDVRGPAEDAEQQSSQTTSEPSSQQEEVPEPKAEATSSSDEGTAQTRESKRLSTRPDGDLSVAVPREKRSRKSISQSKNIVESEETDEREVGGEAEKAVETRRRKSARQSNVSALNENELEKDNEKTAKKGVDTRRRKSARQSKANEGKVDTDAVDDIEIDTNKQNGSRWSRSIKPSNMSINKGNDNEIELEKQEERAGGPRRRKSTRQSNVSEKEVPEEKDGDKETDDVTTNRRKSTRQSSRLEKEEEEEHEKQVVRVKGMSSRGTRRSKGVENVKDDVEKETEVVKSRRISKQQLNGPAGKEVEEEKDEGTEDEVAPETDAETVGETEGEKVEGTKGVEVSETETEREIVTETEVVKSRRKSKQQSSAPAGKEVEGTEDEVAPGTDVETVGETEGEKVEGTKGEEVSETETEREIVTETEEGEKNVEAESEEAVETEVDEMEKTKEENIGKAIKQKDKTVVASKSEVVEDEDDDDTERVFFSLRASFAVPSAHEVEDEFDVADADSQEFGILDDTQKRNRKEAVRTNRKTIAKGGKKNDKERVQKEKPEKLLKSSRRPTKKDKQESKMGKDQKKKASKRGSEIHRDDDQKKLKGSPKESINGDGYDSKLATGGMKSRGKKSNQQKNQLQRSQRSSGSTSQTSSSDADAHSQVDDDPAAAVDLQQKNQRKQRQKKHSNHPAEATNSSKTASDETLGVDEDGPSTSKAGSSSTAFRSRRSSVHFTTKDMISVSGDISIRQVSSTEDKSSDNKEDPPTTATHSKDHKKSRRSSKGRSSGGGAKTRDKAKEDDTINVEEHLSGQSVHESTSESDRETADQEQSRRGRKKGAVAKKPSKRRSSEATSTTSVADDDEASLKPDKEDGVRRTKRQREHPREYWHDHNEPKDHKKSSRLSKGRSSGGGAKTRDKANEDDTINVEEHLSGQSVHESTSESDRETADQGQSRRGRKKGAVAKKPSKRRSSEATSTTSVADDDEASLKPDTEDGVRRTKRQREHPREYWHDHNEPKDHNKSSRSSKGRSSGGGAKTWDKAIKDDTRNVEEHLSGQSVQESTSESDRQTADQGQSRRGRKKGAVAKKPSKRRSSEATSTTSVADDDEASPEDHTTQDSVDHHDANQNQSTDQSTDQSTRGPTPSKSPSTSSSGARSTSTGSILKVSRNWDKRRQNKKNKYSILFTEKPLRKAYIIKPDEEDGVRRTRRQRVRPLEYWRNERPLYERRKSGGLALAGIISPEAPEERVSARSMRQPAKPKGHLPVTPSHISIHASPPVGTSKVCQPTINVVNPDTKQEVAIDAVATSKMLKFTGPSGLPAKPDDAITISKALSQKAFAAGILTVRPLGEKGSQLVRRDTMIFYVVRGKIAMTLHETSQILQSGDWFFVPKGNVYNITNLRKDEAKLTFFQMKSA